jgi:hypothetical protein
MSVLPSDIVVYGSANMPEADGATTGGADRVPGRGVGAASYFALSSGFWPVYSSCHGRQLEERILAQWGDGLQGHVAGALHGPFIVLLEQDGAD